MEIKHVVTHREYTHSGEFHRSFSLAYRLLDEACCDANFVLNYYKATNLITAVNACNITVRGPKGRFMKWRN